MEGTNASKTFRHDAAWRWFTTVLAGFAGPCKRPGACRRKPLPAKTWAPILTPLPPTGSRIFRDRTLERVSMAWPHSRSNRTDRTERKIHSKIAPIAGCLVGSENVGAMKHPPTIHLDRRVKVGAAVPLAGPPPPDPGGSAWWIRRIKFCHGSRRRTRNGESSSCIRTRQPRCGMSNSTRAALCPAFS